MIIMSFVGILHMIFNESCTYIAFPIAMLIWGVIETFREDNDTYYRDITSRTRNSSTVMWKNTSQIANKAEYKKIIGRTGRNNLITTSKINKRK
jgi:hypothetical protein